MSKLARDREVYLPHRTETALRLAAEVLADDNTGTDALAVRYLDECLERDYPGIFEVVEECAAAFDLARADNKKILEEWKKKNAASRLEQEIAQAEYRIEER